MSNFGKQNYLIFDLITSENKKYRFVYFSSYLKATTNNLQNYYSRIKGEYNLV